LKTKLSKFFIYPVAIVTLVSIILISIYSFLGSIGQRMNPPQPAFSLESQIAPAVLWKNSKKEWMFAQGEELSVFDTGHEKYSAKGQLLKTADAKTFGEVVLFVVRESLDKEKSIAFLSVLSRFALKKVYIASPFDDTLAALKNLEPRFWYAASPRSWVKWSLFGAFGIESAFTLEADFVFVDREISKLLSDKLKVEIARRNLPVIRADENGGLIFD